MDITNMLNSKSPAAVAAAEQQLQQHLAQAAQTHGRTVSEAGSELENTSDQSSGYSSRSANPLQTMPTLPNGLHYPQPSQLEQPVSMLPDAYMVQGLGVENGYTHSQIPEDHALLSEQHHDMNRPSLGVEPTKAFSCATCLKGFARRSDLARHERIHSGVRPHVCDYPGCDKQFIQRSALTVHARVHTGEKPHMCECCGKHFSDSSSLARHRRIHSGKRPYKCPYADCQKTFTRRTTLTRHQNHHTGTVEESAAATAAILASRPSGIGQRTGSDGGTYSDTASPHSTPSPGRRNLSMSPSSRLPPMPASNRQPSDFSYMSTGSLPPHIRGDLQQPSRQSSPSLPSPSQSSFGGNQLRPSLTSHPTMYCPPSVLEPPTHHEHQRSGSAGGSPHMSSVGWQSPVQPGMGSPGLGEPYMYPEPPAPHLYYPNSHLRRPQSTEPDHYESKPRLVGGEVWNGHV